MDDQTALLALDIDFLTNRKTKLFKPFPLQSYCWNSLVFIATLGTDLQLSVCFSLQTISFDGVKTLLRIGDFIKYVI